MIREVEEFCKACPECKLTQPKAGPGTELVPMPLVDRPFDQIAMDIMGPLTKSEGGHQYILIIIDYATWYPEPIPLQSTTAKVLAKELLGVFSRVGFPREVLTEQGSDFMSSTFKQMWELLGVKPLKTSVYHLQANGLVERFNRTLKGMLRKMVLEQPRKWHMFVNQLMFAV